MPGPGCKPRFGATDITLGKSRNLWCFSARFRAYGVEAAMNPEEIFHAALARPQAERSDFLQAACSGNPALRKRIEALLHAHENPGSFLADRLAMPAATVDDSATECAGAMIGPYKLLEQIGEGGMGT